MEIEIVAALIAGIVAVGVNAFFSDMIRKRSRAITNSRRELELALAQARADSEQALRKINTLETKLARTPPAIAPSSSADLPLE